MPIVGVGAGKFLGLRVNFAEFSQTCPKNPSKSDLQKKSMLPVLLRFSGSFRFPEIFPEL